jgi:two-component system, NtrC family, sensor kinase
LLKWLRTISGRIVLGFVVLWTTFTVVAGYGIWQMNQLGTRLRFIRSAYMEISPKVQLLQFYTQTFADYLNDERYTRAYLLKNREMRDNWLNQLRGSMDEITDVPPNLTRYVEQTRTQIADFGREHAVNQKLFEIAFPLKEPDPKDVPATEATKKAHRDLQNSEARLAQWMRSLHRRLTDEARQLLAGVERAERYARYWALVMGVLATFAAMMVTAWAVVSLRPLRKLLASARQVALGDYRGRVEAVGGTEVAELAKEFNLMAAAIEEREQELVRSERLAAVGKMAAVITHEIRNPLSSIGLNTELLDDELDRIASGDASPQEARALLASVHKEVDRLTVITEEYLRFARLPRPKLERLELNDVASELVAFQKAELSARGVNVESTLARDLPDVLADEGQLRQALLNLVRNAAEAVGDRGTVRVATRRTPAGSVEIRVEDDGPGIPAEHLPKIFEPFFSTKDGGTGLGLALTQQIIVEHGGRIQVEASDRGTAFAIELPAA